jgi:AraC-like DNA-binding protein
LRQPAGAAVSYVEYHGLLEPVAEARPATGDIVVLSNVEKAATLSQPRAGLCLRYVGRGSETYRIDGRSYRLDEGQVMVARQDRGAEIEVGRRERHGTLGLCVLIAPDEDEMSWLCGPVVFSSGCTSIGPVMEKQAKLLCAPTPRKQEIASHLASSLRTAMPSMTNAVLDQLAAMEAAKPATRYELVRRANLAQAYLHSVVDRAVSLEELASAVGASPFQLLRSFQKCFGDTPAAYHRRLRLNLVVAEAERRRISLAAACGDFGFADGSSFSHAYRRTFGRAPVWSKGN